MMKNIEHFFVCACFPVVILSGCVYHNAFENVGSAAYEIEMVQLPNGLYMGKYEVTQAQWEAVMGDNPSHFKGADLPVERVSYEECLEFIKRLNGKTGENYRLPTDLEWEYACRAGSGGIFCNLSGGIEGVIDEVGWYAGNSGGTTHPVGQKHPNAFGLYDMHGNVGEWTSTPETLRITYRGGSFCDTSDCCECDSADFEFSYIHLKNLGLRLSKVPSEKENAVKENCKAEKKRILENLIPEMIALPNKNCKLCKYEVTQALWKNVMGQNPSYFKGTNRPVEQVSFVMCNEFIKRLNEITGGRYRLPSDEEWEYACRAGSRGKYGLLVSGKEGRLDEMGWYRGNSGAQTHPIGQKQPNAWGFYDMHGNVEEWIMESTFPNSIIRGGSWDGFPNHCMADCKIGWYSWQNPGNTRGFRLASPLSNEEMANVSNNVLNKLKADMVTIPGKNYAVCKFEVTQLLWQTVMGNNPSFFKGGDRPVECVTWNECHDFLNKLNIVTGAKYRLLTKEEWEYACIADETGKTAQTVTNIEVPLERTYEDYSLKEKAWFRENSEGKTHPVGQKMPNPFGLYDMHGNVCEWTSEGDDVDCLYCGSCWNDNAGHCLANRHFWGSSDDRYCNIGLRLAITLEADQ